MWRVLICAQIILRTIVFTQSSPVIDFQFLLDPKEAQVSLDKLDKVAEVVERKRCDWSEELKEVEAEGSVETPELRRLHDSIQTIKTPSDYKDILEQYGKLRVTKEKGEQLKEKIVLAGSFLETMDDLKGLLTNESHNGINPAYIQFSQIRNVIKTLRSLSFDLFSPAEAATDFGEICLDILSIRKPSVDLKKDYKELCF